MACGWLLDQWLIVCCKWECFVRKMWCAARVGNGIEWWCRRTDGMSRMLLLVAGVELTGSTSLCGGAVAVGFPCHHSFSG